MDVDDLVTGLTGTEGAQRYLRLGVYLVIGGLLGVLVMTALPLYTMGGEDITYSDLRDDPDPPPLFIPNHVPLRYAYMAIFAYVGVLVVGLLFALEGLGVIHLRRYLVWHSEVRATALYALATAVVFLAVVASGAVLSFSLGEPAFLVGGVYEMVEVGSPAGAWSLAVGIPLVLGMLVMVYYNTVLSVYRGGFTRAFRRMARYSMIVVLVSLLAGFMLHSMVVMVIEWNFAPEAGDEDLILPYTLGDIDHLADSGGGSMEMRALDTSLDILGWASLACALMGLAGMVGVAAISMRATSKLARRAATMPALAFMPAVLCILGAILADGHIQTQGGGTLYLVIYPYTGTPVLAAIVVGVLAVILAGLFLRELGRDFFLDALRPGPTPSGEPYDGVIATAAGPTPVPAGAVSEGDVGRRAEDKSPGPLTAGEGSAKAKARVLAVAGIVVIIVVTAVSHGFISGGDDDGGGGNTVVLDDLDPFMQVWEGQMYMAEGTQETYNVMSQVLPDLGAEEAVFITRIRVAVSWMDEADESNPLVRWENQPDEFAFELGDSAGYLDASGGGQNVHGQVRMLEFNWMESGTVMGYGNDGLVRLDDVEVTWEDVVTLDVTMVSAGDHTHPRRPDRTDGGNNVIIDIGVEGRIILEGP